MSELVRRVRRTLVCEPECTYTVDVLDIVPGGRSGDDASWGRELAQRQERAHARRTIEAPRVVKLTNKLPARLRRPVRDELERQRRRQRVRDAVVRFERRPLYSEVPSAPPRHAQSRPPLASLPGAEQHTGDVYMQSRPEVNLPAPPYAGSFVRRGPRPPAGQAGRIVKARPLQRAATLVAPTSPRRVGSLVKKPRVVQSAARPVRPEAQTVTFSPSRPRPVESGAMLDSAEREPRQRIVQPPSRRFALPLHFSIFPLSLWPRRGTAAPEEAHIVPAEDPATPKKKLPRE